MKRIIIVLFSVLISYSYCFAKTIKFNKYVIFEGDIEKLEVEDNDQNTSETRREMKQAFREMLEVSSQGTYQSNGVTYTKYSVPAEGSVGVLKIIDPQSKDEIIIKGRWKTNSLSFVNRDRYYYLTSEIVSFPNNVELSGKSVQVTIIDKHEEKAADIFVTIDNLTLSAPRICLKSSMTYLDNTTLSALKYQSVKIYFNITKDKLTYSHDLSTEFILNGVSLKMPQFDYTGDIKVNIEDNWSVSPVVYLTDEAATKGKLVTDLGTYTGSFYNKPLKDYITNGVSFSNVGMKEGTLILKNNDRREGTFKHGSLELNKGKLDIHTKKGHFVGNVDFTGAFPKIEGDYYVSENEKYKNATWTINSVDNINHINIVKGKVHYKNDKLQIDCDYDNSEIVSGVYKGTYNSNKYDGYFDGIFKDGYFVDGKINAFITSSDKIEFYKGDMDNKLFTGVYKKTNYKTENKNFEFEGSLQNGEFSGTFHFFSKTPEKIGFRYGHNEEIMDNCILTGEWNEHKCLNAEINLNVSGCNFSGSLKYENNQYKILIMQDKKKITTFTLNSDKYDVYPIIHSVYSEVEKIAHELELEKYIKSSLGREFSLIQINMFGNAAIEYQLKFIDSKKVQYSQEYDSPNKYANAIWGADNGKAILNYKIQNGHIVVFNKDEKEVMYLDFISANAIELRTAKGTHSYILRADR
ncbi:MAG: hypothetical protein MJY63_03160 [Paludibacteraceae bacterium]|nr:hypothetical protein [Paludibacteraceae bacterium]